MSDAVEQITKDPREESKDKTPREKDPKKVAAGKKLAEANKLARAALARERKREAEEKKKSEPTTDDSEDTETSSSSSEAWIPELSFSNVLTIIGLGFAAFNAYMMYRNKSGEVFEWHPVTTVMPQSKEPPPPSKIPVPTPPRETHPKIGML